MAPVYNVREIRMYDATTYANFHASSCHCLISAQHVVMMQAREFSHGLGVQCFGRRRLVEIQITSHRFVGSFAAQDALDAERLDKARQKVPAKTLVSLCSQGHKITYMGVPARIVVTSYLRCHE